MTTHERYEELAAAATDFDLTPDEQSALDRHLDTCSSCRATVEGYRADAAGLRAMAFAEPPDRVRTAIMTGATARTRRAVQPWKLLLAAALLLGVLVGTSLAVGAWITRPSPLVVVPVPSSSAEPSFAVVDSSPSAEPSRATSGPVATATPSPTAAATPRATQAPRSTATPRATRTLTPTIAAVPANDRPPGTIIGSLPFADTINTSRAEIHAMEPSLQCARGLNSVWYAYTAAADRVVVVDTDGSDYDTLIDVWTGQLTADLMEPGFEQLIPLTCDDNTSTSMQAMVSFETQAGQSYVIRVMAVGEVPAGTLRLTVTSN